VRDRERQRQAETHTYTHIYRLIDNKWRGTEAYIKRDTHTEIDKMETGGGEIVKVIQKREIHTQSSLI
jgi:hypothetical protein